MKIVFRIELPNDRSESYIRAIEKSVNPQMDLVCCILTNNRKDRYDAIKKVLCVDCPIPSQVFSFEFTMFLLILSFFSDALIENITKTRSINVSGNKSWYSN
jgi:hypothetical protein